MRHRTCPAVAGGKGGHVVHPRLPSTALIRGGVDHLRIVTTAGQPRLAADAARRGRAIGPVRAAAAVPAKGGDPAGLLVPGAATGAAGAVSDGPVVAAATEGGATAAHDAADGLGRCMAGDIEGARRLRLRGAGNADCDE